MTKKILISEIKIDRELRGSVANLVEHDLDLEQPIVLQNGRLIDGLRRVELAKQKGITELPYVDPQNMEEAVEVLSKAHTTPMKDWMRVYELMKYLQPLADGRSRRNRAEHLDRLLKGDQTVTHPTVRQLIAKALGGTSSSHFENVVRLIEHGPREIVLEVLHGRLSPAGGVARMRRRERFQHRVIEPEAQEALFNTALTNFRTTLDSMWMLGKVGIEEDKYNALMKGLRLVRRELASLINQLEEAGK